MTTDDRALCAELLEDAAELADLMQGVIDGDYAPDSLTLQPIRGSMARARAALAQPEPQGPAERIASIAKAVQECAFAWEPTAQLIGNVCAEDVADLCSAVLTRYAHPTPQPIPVSERLPEAKDCDAEGRCWFGMWGEIDGEMIPDWELTRLEDYTNEGRLRLAGWLPAHALPLPRQPAADAAAP